MLIFFKPKVEYLSPMLPSGGRNCQLIWWYFLPFKVYKEKQLTPSLQPENDIKKLSLIDNSHLKKLKTGRQKTFYLCLFSISVCVSFLSLFLSLFNLLLSICRLCVSFVSPYNFFSPLLSLSFFLWVWDSLSVFLPLFFLFLSLSSTLSIAFLSISLSVCMSFCVTFCQCRYSRSVFFTTYCLSLYLSSFLSLSFFYLGLSCLCLCLSFF